MHYAQTIWTVHYSFKNQTANISLTVDPIAVPYIMLDPNPDMYLPYRYNKLKQHLLQLQPLDFLEFKVYAYMRPY